jgi:hypothetical protein
VEPDDAGAGTGGFADAVAGADGGQPVVAERLEDLLLLRPGVEAEDVADVADRVGGVPVRLREELAVDLVGDAARQP